MGGGLSNIWCNAMCVPSRRMLRHRGAKTLFVFGALTEQAWRRPTDGRTDVEIVVSSLTLSAETTPVSLLFPCVFVSVAVLSLSLFFSHA